MLPNIEIGHIAKVIQSAADAAIQKKIHGLGHPGIGRTTALIISNEKMDNIIKTIKSLDEFGLIVKGQSQAIEKK